MLLDRSPASDPETPTPATPIPGQPVPPQPTAIDAAAGPLSPPVDGSSAYPEDFASTAIPPASPSPLPKDLNAALARLELSSLQVRHHLDSIEEKISRMEPRLEGMQQPPVSVPFTSPRPAPPPDAEPSALAELDEPYRIAAAVPAESTTDRRRRLQDLPLDRRRPPIVAEPSPVQVRSSLQGWLTEHRVESSLIAAALLGFIAVLSFGASRRASTTGRTPAAPAALTPSTPAPAPSSTSTARPSADILANPVESSTAAAGTSLAGRPVPTSPADQTPANPSGADTQPATPNEAAVDPSLPAADPSAAPPADLSANPDHHVPRIATGTSTRLLPSGRLQVSSGVMAGNLVYSRPPKYPRGLASIFRSEGKVTMQAVISRTGLVEHLHVLSGPRLLRGAAKDSVSAWRYRPFLVNGNPVEVATIVSVEFRR